jgi:hypothetical protein
MVVCCSKDVSFWRVGFEETVSSFKIILMLIFHFHIQNSPLYPFVSLMKPIYIPTSVSLRFSLFRISHLPHAYCILHNFNSNNIWRGEQITKILIFRNTLKINTVLILNLYSKCLWLEMLFCSAVICVCKSSYPCNRLLRPIGLRDVEALTLFIQSSHRWRWGYQP